MASRLDRVRFRGELAVFDTVFSPEMKPAPETGWRGSLVCRLFGNRNIGDLNLCNLERAGVISTDRRAQVTSMESRLWFDGPSDEARHCLDLWEATTTLQLYIGDQPMVRVPLPAGAFVEKGQPLPDGFPSTRYYVVHFKRAGGWGVPSRQNFSVDVHTTADAIAEVEAFPGRKLFQVWLRGALHEERDD